MLQPVDGGCGGAQPYDPIINNVIFNKVFIEYTSYSVEVHHVYSLWVYL